MFANHGRIDKYDHEIEGVNSRLDGLQAAILEVKLKHLPSWSEARRKNAYLYNDYLKEAGLVLPVEIANVGSSISSVYCANEKGASPENSR